MSLYQSKRSTYRATIAFARVVIALPVKVITVLGLIVACVTYADDDPSLSPRDTVFYQSPPSADDLGAHLFPKSGIKSRSRSITFADSQDQSEPEKSVSMPVLFHFGKTTIVEESRPFVDSVGEMLLKEEYATSKLIVEGHTDAVGSESSNQRLSEQRALAIKEYLVTRYGIDPFRLFPTGKGESNLFKPETPSDGENRRVEFLAYQKE